VIFVSYIFCATVFAQPSKVTNHTIQQYLNIRSASSPRLSPDGKRLAYLTNVSGTTQIWIVDLNKEDARQATVFEDNVSFVRWLPDGKSLIFGKAVGGNENTQFFRLDLIGNKYKELTANPQVRHNFGEVSKDGKRIYYTSNKRDKNYFDIYAMDASSGREELILQQDGNNDFAAVSDDGSRIIISRSGTELGLDNSLYLVDARTREATLLTAHEGAAQYGDVNFINNDTIVFGTNEGGEFITPCRMNLKTRKISGCDRGDWDLDALEMSETGDMAAWTINREGFSELYINKVNSKTGELVKPAPIKLPAQGIVGGLDFSKDANKLVFSFSSAKYNSDVWIYDLKSKQLTQVTKSDRASIPQASFVEPQLIKYKSFDGRDIPAWFYRPNTVTKLPSEKYPVIVSVHGGPEGQERPGFNPLYQYYLARGYAILATNVRGSTGYGKTFTHLDDVEKREDSVKDLAYAVEWLKANGADAKRIAVMGGSYGGYMTLAAITLYPDLFAAAVNTVGIANWESFLKNTSGYRRRQREVEYGMLDRDIDFLRSISPLAKVDKIKTPLFVIHGKNDPRVPYTEAEQIVASLKKRGAKVEYKLFDDEGHGISKLKNRLELFPLVAEFLDKNMK
ncbi:MAG: S9 family peptidase, partial [Acidobacteria bacterium]|nr:S9 family peptidase [Acidobacteriota bacterium]